MDDFEIPERRVDLDRWAKNPLEIDHASHPSSRYLGLFSAA